MRKEQQGSIEVLLGHAADPVGNGVAYARLRSIQGERLVRVPFRVQRFAGLDGREVGYAALNAIASLIRERGVERATFVLNDGQLVADLEEHRDVPPPIVLPYVRLRCTLNRFASHTLRVSTDGDDLAQRAKAEVAFHQAA